MLGLSIRFLKSAMYPFIPFCYVSISAWGFPVIVSCSHFSIAESALNATLWTFLSNRFLHPTFGKLTAWFSSSHIFIALVDFQWGNAIISLLLILSMGTLSIPFVYISVNLLCPFWSLWEFLFIFMMDEQGLKSRCCLHVLLHTHTYIRIIWGVKWGREKP